MNCRVPFELKLLVQLPFIASTLPKRKFALPFCLGPSRPKNNGDRLGIGVFAQKYCGPFGYKSIVAHAALIPRVPGRGMRLWATNRSNPMACVHCQWPTFHRKCFSNHRSPLQQPFSAIAGCCCTSQARPLTSPTPHTCGIVQLRKGMGHICVQENRVWDLPLKACLPLVWRGEGILGRLWAAPDCSCQLEGTVRRTVEGGCLLAVLKPST